jgi:predicted DNA-binding protein
MYNKKLIFRLDEELEARLKLRSAELGISYAEYIRELISKELLTNNLDTIYSFMLKLDKVYNELNRIGINLNQVVKKMNSKNVKNEVLDFEDIVINYCEEIAEILEDFGGIENAINNENRRRKENECKGNESTI